MCNKPLPDSGVIETRGRGRERAGRRGVEERDERDPVYDYVSARGKEGEGGSREREDGVGREEEQGEVRRGGSRGEGSRG